MVEFKNVVAGTELKNWWDNDSKQIAFCRGNRGFIAINGEFGIDLNRNLQTCLPSGRYCDIISGKKVGNSCTGKTVNVDGSGNAQIIIKHNEEDGILAIHVKSKL